MMQWLGVRPSDLDRYKLPEQCRLDMSETDLNTGRQLLKEEFVQKNPEWVKVGNERHCPTMVVVVVGCTLGLVISLMRPSCLSVVGDIAGAGADDEDQEEGRDPYV